MDYANAALVYTYTRAVPGREAHAFEAFTDALSFWEKQAIDGQCLTPETFMGRQTNMIVVRGLRRKLEDIIDSTNHRKLYARSLFVVEDLRMELFATGDEVQRQMQIWASAGAELGYL
jgi:hypothetical protein